MLLEGAGLGNLGQSSSCERASRVCGRGKEGRRLIRRVAATCEEEDNGASKVCLCLTFLFGEQAEHGDGAGIVGNAGEMPEQSSASPPPSLECVTLIALRLASAGLASSSPLPNQSFFFFSPSPSPSLLSVTRIPPPPGSYVNVNICSTCRSFSLCILLGPTPFVA